MFHQTEESQLAAFVAENTLGEEEKKCRLQILEDLEANLKKFYPSLKMNLFGSSATGLAEKNSDIDVQVDIFGDIDSTGYNKTPNARQRETFKNLFERIKSLKSTSGEPVFKDATFIEMANPEMPLIRLTHARSNTSWDLSIKNQFSLQNTQLMKLMVSLDSRVLPFMIIVRQWGKAIGFVGSAQTQLSKFSLGLLGIVYLHRKGILPSVYQLQSWDATTRPASPSSWDASFLNDKQRVLGFMEASGKFKTTKTETVVQLAIGFFETFASFDPQFIVCTLTGDFVSSAVFKNVKDIPIEFKRYKMYMESAFQREPLHQHHNDGLTIQDPFVLNLHVKSIEEKAFTNFKEFCGKAAKFLKEKRSVSSCVSLKDFILAMSKK